MFKSPDLDYHVEPDQALYQSTIITADAALNYVVGDLNNDGLNDLCYYENGLQCALNTGGGTFDTPRQWTAALAPAHWEPGDALTREAKLMTLSLLDLNQDGLLDYCVLGRSRYLLWHR